MPASVYAAPTATAPVIASVSLPGSKSLANRALILAALASGPSVVRRALRSRDTLLMAQALTALGAHVDTSGDDWVVTPAAFTGDAEIDCGLAGTVMRFVPALAGLSTGSARFDGDDHMRTRPVGAMLTALRTLGVQINDDGRAGLPFTVVGSGSVPGGSVSIDASASSQFISALLLAGARFDQGVDIRHVGAPIPSQPHIDMTVALLREHGVSVDDSHTDRWVVAPGPIQPLDRVIEPDLSNAGAFLALGAVTGGSVTVRDWPEATTQPGDRWREIFTAMGCTVTQGADGLTVSGTGPLQPVDLDLHDEGELTPVVAALCALATGTSYLRGIGHIRGHETDRLTALATELNALGADVIEHPDALEIRPGSLHGGTFRTYDDHRMAHAGVVIGAVVPGVEVENIATTSKTFPDFAAAWDGMFA